MVQVLVCFIKNSLIEFNIISCNNVRVRHFSRFSKYGNEMAHIKQWQSLAVPHIFRPINIINAASA